MWGQQPSLCPSLCLLSSECVHESLAAQLGWCHVGWRGQRAWEIGVSLSEKVLVFLHLGTIGESMGSWSKRRGGRGNAPCPAPGL